MFGKEVIGRENLQKKLKREMNVSVERIILKKKSKIKRNVEKYFLIFLKSKNKKQKIKSAVVI
jgi:hypothetical protein